MTYNKKIIIQRQLHQMVADRLHAEISHLRAGKRLESESRMAKRFGVSVVTVREALRSLAQEGLVIRRHGSGTFVSGQTNRQHVAILFEADLSSPSVSYIYLRMLEQTRKFFDDREIPAQLYIGKHPYNTPGSDPKWRDHLNCPEFLNDLKLRKFSGVMAVFTQPHEHWTSVLTAQGIPIVGTGEGFPYHVRINPLDVVDRGVRYLMAQGRKRIAALGWEEPSGQSTAVASAFRDTVRKILAERGLEMRDAWVRTDLWPSLPGAGMTQFQRAWSAYEEKPDGLLVSDDVLSRDVAMAILAAGIRVPEQLLMVSHANQGSSIAYPFPVIRMEIDPDAWALVLGQMLLKLIHKETPDERVVILPHRVLLPGESAGITSPETKAMNQKQIP